MESGIDHDTLAQLAADIKVWGAELGFARIGIADVDLGETETRLADWLAQGFHGDMDYMARHGAARARPAELVPGTVRVITARLDYLPRSVGPAWIKEGWQSIDDPQRATVSRYAHGRDYHKVMRGRLQRLSERVAERVGAYGHRVFTDSAPVMEVELARQSGLGWRGKHTLLLSRDAGSMFFLGEIYVDLPLPVDDATSAHCGRCTRCIDICPTQAIVAPYVLDARRCISYLTIEHPGSIPEEFRNAIGNRIYGCDDCQLVCPWNKYARRATLDDFDSRGLDRASLIDLFAWSEEEFLKRTEGSAIRRIGHERWLRNLAVGLGNALSVEKDAAQRQAIVTALRARADHPSALVREHVGWALERE